MNIEHLKTQLNQCIAQRDQHAACFQQAIGAINLLQEQIKMLLVQEALEKKQAEQAQQGELENGANDQSPQETA